LEAGRADAEFYGNHLAGDPVKKLGRHGVKGAVFRLAEGQRSDFG